MLFSTVLFDDKALSSNWFVSQHVATLLNKNQLQRHHSFPSASVDPDKYRVLRQRGSWRREITTQSDGLWTLGGAQYLSTMQL
jgi:hypothetical protein